MDRLDYLRRDSLFTGAGYGHFDWYRLLNTFEIYDDESGRDLVWSAKSLLSIEEYVLSRYYMYQNVYLHKTTCGFEAMLVAMWTRARKLHKEGGDAGLLPTIKAFWDAKRPTVRQYLAIEEFTVLLQIQNWTAHPDPSLSDLARRFLNRKGFGMVNPPDFGDAVVPNYQKWESKLRAIVKKKSEYSPVEMYCLKYKLKGKYSQPYIPEKEKDQQTAVNSIRVLFEDESKPVEVSKRLERLRSLTETPPDQYRYYVPKDV
jgi:HD superfamily phosphohydrolase